MDYNTALAVVTLVHDIQLIGMLHASLDDCMDSMLQEDRISEMIHAFCEQSRIVLVCINETILLPCKDTTSRCHMNMICYFQ